MEVSELIDALKRYPGDLRVLVFDRKNGAYMEPELKIADLIAVTEFGSEKICELSKKWQYGDGRRIKALTIR